MHGEDRLNIKTQLIIGALKLAEFPDHISIDYAVLWLSGRFLTQVKYALIRLRHIFWLVNTETEYLLLDSCVSCLDLFVELCIIRTDPSPSQPSLWLAPLPN